MGHEKDARCLESYSRYRTGRMDRTKAYSRHLTVKNDPELQDHIAEMVKGAHLNAYCLTTFVIERPAFMSGVCVQFWMMEDGGSRLGLPSGSRRGYYVGLMYIVQLAYCRPRSSCWSEVHLRLVVHCDGGIYLADVMSTALQLQKREMREL